MYEELIGLFWNLMLVLRIQIKMKLRRSTLNSMIHQRAVLKNLGIFLTVTSLVATVLAVTRMMVVTTTLSGTTHRNVMNIRYEFLGFHQLLEIGFFCDFFLFLYLVYMKIP